MAKTKVDDQTKYGERIANLEENIGAVDEARVALEERVEKLEALTTQLMQKGHAATVPTDSMGLPKVV